MNKNINKHIDKNVRKLMLDNGIKTIRELSKKSGVCERTLLFISSFDLRLSTLIRIANALNTPVYKLLIEDKKSSEVQ